MWFSHHLFSVLNVDIEVFVGYNFTKYVYNSRIAFMQFF